MTISTHVLDVSLGKPGGDIEVVLEYKADGGWQELARERTNSDGRTPKMGDGTIKNGVYQLRYDTEAYWKKRNIQGFFPSVTVSFEIVDSDQHYHVPVLLSPYSYSAYRGS